MQVYKLTDDEQLAIRCASGQRNAVPIICDLDGIGCVVDYNALISADLAEYLAVISPLDDSRIIEYIQDISPSLSPSVSISPSPSPSPSMSPSPSPSFT